MIIECMEVISQISDYIDGNVESRLRLAIREHIRGCNHCAAIYDGTRNVIQLVCDGRTFELPAGFSDRMEARLATHR